MAELTAWAREVRSAWPDPVGFPLCVIEGAFGVRFGCDGAAPRAWRELATQLLDALAAVEKRRNTARPSARRRKDDDHGRWPP